MAYTDSVSVYKADSGSRGGNTNNLVIEAIRTIPEFVGSDWREKSIAAYEKDAKTLFDALTKHLPGATIDRLAILLLENQASLLRVPNPSL